MFSYTGLTPEQVATAQADSHVYILKTGRISIAGCELIPKVFLVLLLILPAQ
jgi:aspartate aminotransferase